MGFDKVIEIIERIDQLIRLKATGTPQELSLKLELSERTVYRYVDEMKALGVPIEYDKNYGSYIYTRSVPFHKPFEEE